MEAACGALLAVAGGANLVGALLVVADKRRARTGNRRIRERTLWLTALLVGWPLMLVAMVAVHHKTRKAAFLAPFVACALVGTAALAWGLQALDCVPSWPL